MKMYIKPSLDISKFDVEDIITTSGNVGSLGDMSTQSQSIYKQYLLDDNSRNSEDKVVEFEW